MPRIHPLAPLAVPALLALLALDPAVPGARAEDEIDVLRVPTVWRTHDEHASRAGGARGDLLADVQATDTVDLGPTPPPGTGAVPPGRLRYGTLAVGPRRFLVALGESEGQSAVMGVDLDGDGNLRGPEEVVTSPGRAGRSQGRATLRWRFPSKQLGALKLDVTFRQLAQVSQAVQIGPSPVQLELTEGPPGGCAAVKVAGHVRYTAVQTAQGPRGGPSCGGRESGSPSSSTSTATA